MSSFLSGKCKIGVKFLIDIKSTQAVFTVWALILREESKGTVDFVAHDLAGKV